MPTADNLIHSKTVIAFRASSAVLHLIPVSGEGEHYFSNLHQGGLRTSLRLPATYADDVDAQHPL